MKNSASRLRGINRYAEMIQAAVSQSTQPGRPDYAAGSNFASSSPPPSEAQTVDLDGTGVGIDVFIIGISTVGYAFIV